MVDNSGGGTRQKQPSIPMVDCPRCGQKTQRLEFCGQCGKPLNVVCSNPACAKTVPNKKHCGECGTLLEPATASPASSKKETWKLEVTPAGEKGDYSVRVQATKDSKGAKAEIWVAGNGLTVFGFPDSGGNLTAGRGMALGKSVRNTDPSATEADKLPTDDNGLLVLSVRFNRRRAFMSAAVVGTEADTVVRLDGSKFEAPKRGSFAEAFRKTVAYHRQSR